MSDPLFQPIAIGGLEIKNRIVMPAMHLNMCRDFLVNDRLISFYRERAEGGAGLISVGYATVDEYSGAPGNIGAISTTTSPVSRNWPGPSRTGGARAAVQLNHAGRYNPSFFLGGRPAVAPSPVASRLTRETPRELLRRGDHRCRRPFRRCRRAGEDGGFRPGRDPRRHRLPDQFIPLAADQPPC